MKRTLPYAGVLLILAATFSVLVSTLSRARLQNAAIELAVDTAVPNQDGLLVLYGAMRLGGDVGLPVAAGDINGDGRADVVFCEMYANAGVGTRLQNGQVNFYISDGRDSGFVDAAQQPANIFTLVGAASGDLLGTSVSVGDVNNDGLGDVVVCASASDGPGQSRFNAGTAYIVPGSRSFNLRADLATLDGVPPAGIVAIHGPQTGGRFGIWVDTGDVDGDRIADIVVGADQLNSDAGQHVGGAYIIFGSAALPAVIDLASPPPGVRIARVLGASEEDHNGAALHVGDVNSDGIGDLLLGASIFRDSASYVTPQDQDSGHDARGASFGGQRPGCGEVSVIYGSSNWPAEIDLRRAPATSSRVIGANRGDLLGSQLFSADLNGDGARELILGALQALAPDGRGRPGAVYIVYGSPQVVGATIDLAAPDSSGLRVTTIYGEDHLDCAGDSVRSYDINRDGLFDLFIGSPEHSFELNGVEREEAGDTKLIFGQREFLPPVVKLYDVPPGLRVFKLAGPEGEAQGIAGGDEFSYRLAGADIDGDGFTDYVANAMHGDGFLNRVVNAGEVYVFSGKTLSARLGMLRELEPAPNLVRASLLAGGQIVQQANAGQTGLRIEVKGSRLRTDTEVLINGIPVISRLSGPSPAGLPVQTVELDENPAIRNAVGQLAVQARNTNPPSEISNTLIAGSLVGPVIGSITTRRKQTGAVVLRVSGSNFQPAVTVSVLDADGNVVPIKSVSFVAADSLTVKIRGTAVQPGALLRVRVVAPGGVQSNQVTVVAP